MDDLWTCPSCERRFARQNQWHSCIDLTLDDYLASQTPAVVALYRAVEEAIAACGGFRVHPQKTRVAFIARMTFAGLRPAGQWADLQFITPALIDDRRIDRIELYGPTSFAHTIRLTTPGNVDADVAGWLCEAHRRGEQESLDSSADVRPVTGPALRRLLVPVRATVQEVPAGLSLRLPRFACQALAAHPDVAVRVRGELHPGEIGSDGHCRVVLDDGVIASLGLGAGDEVDVVLAAAL